MCKNGLVTEGKIKLTNSEMELLKKVGAVSSQFPIHADKWDMISYEILERAIRSHIRKYYSYNKTLTDKYLKIIDKLKELKK